MLEHEAKPLLFRAGAIEHMFGTRPGLLGRGPNWGQVVEHIKSLDMFERQILPPTLSLWPRKKNLLKNF